MHRELSFYFDTVLNFSGSVTEHNFVLRCIPADNPEQKILSYTLTVLPNAGPGTVGKDSFGNWSTKGHPDRVVNIDQSVLKLFASLIDGTENWKEARMPTLHAKQILQVLQRFSLSSL